MKDSVLVFGGGELQISIINKAKLLGLQVIVIDPNDLAQAKDVADVFVCVGGDDFEKTLEIALKYNVKGLVTAATDHPILMMCRIAEAMKLNFPTYDSCETLLDKGKFKSFLQENGFKHANGNVYNDVANFKIFNYNVPLIVKPLKNSGSRGVIKCESFDTLDAAVSECLRYCRDGRFIIEEFIVGDEISVEAIVKEGKVHIIQITDKIVSNPPYNVELGHIQPSKYSHREDEIQEILQQIVTLTGFDNSAIHPEFKITEQGDIFIIEIGTRLGGDYITSDLTYLSTGVDIENLQIFISLGKNITFTKSNMCSAISFLNFQEDTVIHKNIDKKQLLYSFPEIFRFESNLKPNDKIKIVTNSLERYGYFILQSNSMEEIIDSKAKIIDFLHNKYSS